MKIDIYNHVMPMRYLEMMKQHSKDQGIVKRMSNLRMLWDIEARVDMLDTKFPEVQQIITLGLPSPELLGGPELSPELARIANDGMAEMVRKWPKKFPHFIASLPMNNVPAALEEMDRAVKKLEARGVQICTNVAGRPLDEPEYFPVFEHATKKHDIPIWMHPARPGTRADYLNEPKSKYEIWQVLGWPYETSVAMAHMVFGGLFDRHPGFKLITHHMGGMIPYFEGRVGPGWDQLGTRTSDEDYTVITKEMKRKGRRPVDYFRNFYADTALFGALEATKCGLAFFGVDKTLFASDAPFDPEGGRMYIRETLKVIERLELAPEARRAVYEGNLRRLCHGRLGAH